MGYRQAFDRSVGIQHVDRAPVGGMRNGKPGDARECRLVVERGGEHGARLGKEPEPALGILGIRSRLLLTLQQRRASKVGKYPVGDVDVRYHRSTDMLRHRCGKKLEPALLLR